MNKGEVHVEENKIITIAVPKGRLQKQIAEYLAVRGVTIKEESRKLDYLGENSDYKFLFVKNGDVPVYVNYGVADLGFSGSDVIYESDFEFLHLARLPFGGTKICVAGREEDRGFFEKDKFKRDDGIKPIKVATKFTRFTNHYFEELGIPIQIIKLTGSVELAPILGLARFIVDLVETGSTLHENNLVPIKEIEPTYVKLIANPSLYRQNYRKINEFVEILQRQG